MSSPDMVASAEQRLLAATTQFDTASAALYQSDGRPIYAPDVHQQQLSALQEALRSETTAIEQLLTSERAAAERAVMQLEGVDVADLLSPDELSRANARALFVKEDADGLPLVELLARVKSVTLGSDRALAYLWHRYASVRIAAEQKDQKKFRPQPEAEALAALNPLLRGMVAQIEGPERAQQRERAAARVKQIERARIAAFRERSSRLEPRKPGSMARL